MVNEYDADGRIVGPAPAAPALQAVLPGHRLDPAPEDEHRLLSALLTCFLRLRRAAGRAAHRVRWPSSACRSRSRSALPPPEDRAFADVWSALGGELKPSLDLVVSAPVDTGQRRETGPPVDPAAAGGRSVARTAGRQRRGRPARGSAERPASATAPRGERRVTSGPDRDQQRRARDPARKPDAPGSVTCWRGSRWSRTRVAGAGRAPAPADDPAPDDPFRGLYLSDEDVDQLLAARPTRAARDDRRRWRGRGRGGPSRGRRQRHPAARAWPRTPRLTALDVELLLIALLPDLDARFERLYGYLNDDVTRRRATVGLALELAGAVRRCRPPPAARLSPAAPLVDRGLRARRGPGTAVPDPRRCGCRTGWPRTCSATTRPDPALARPGRRASPPYRRPTLAGQLGPGPAARGVRLVYLRERSRPAPGRRSPRAALLGPAGDGRGRLDLRRLAARPRSAAALVDARGPRGPAARGGTGRRAGRGPGRELRRRPLHRLGRGRRAGAAGRHVDLGPAVVDRHARCWSTRPRSARADRGSTSGRERCWAPAAELDPALLRGPPRTRARADQQRRPGGAASATLDGRPLSTPTTCAAAHAPRTPPASSGSPAASSPRSAGTTWCSPRRSSRQLRRARRPGPAPRHGARRLADAAAAAGAATASPPCSPATPAPARRCRPR